MFKKMRNHFPQSTADFDSRIVSYMLPILFDRETLSRSSANGGIANNVGISHAPLDPVRLKFLKGTLNSNYTLRT